ncbi:MAG: hypothetical protein JWM78_89 [Verrucomicrobiaceae bacterium]|nr:hypothetical protein [Verrucomicrobiaceae bacterium]
MVNVFIVGEAPTLVDVFKLYFDRRDRPIVNIEIDQLALPPRSDDDVAAIVIVDCANQLGGAVLPFTAFKPLIDDCAAREWPVLMLSDSRVFAAGNQRYRERDLAIPASAEGEILLQCEHYLAEQTERHVILRTGPLLAASGTNLLTYFVRQMQEGGDVLAATEPRFCPISIFDLARVVAAICDQVQCAAECWGIYHYHSSDTATLYEFAEVVLAAASQYWNLSDKAHLKADAMSFHSSSFPIMNCQKIRDTFGIQQTQWRKAIPDLLKQMQMGEPR